MWKLLFFLEAVHDDLTLIKFKINVKGGVITARAFLPTRKAGASLVAVSSAVVSLPPVALPGTSSYVSSKLAQIKFFEFVAAEYPDLQVVTVHPGVVDTAMNAKSEIEGLPMDDGKSDLHDFTKSKVLHE